MLTLARLLLVIGTVCLVLGGLFFIAARANISFDRLPGTLRLQGSNFTCVFALGASILLSILLTLILNVLARFLNR